MARHATGPVPQPPAPLQWYRIDSLDGTRIEDPDKYLVTVRVDELVLWMRHYADEMNAPVLRAFSRALLRDAKKAKVQTL